MAALASAAPVAVPRVVVVVVVVVDGAAGTGSFGYEIGSAGAGTGAPGT